MKHPFFKVLLILTALGLSSPAQAQTFDFTSYYPAPSANYQQISLEPQPQLPTDNCEVGNIYSNADDANKLYFCKNSDADNPAPHYIPFPGVWTLNTNDLYLSDTSYPESKKVGIGTSTPSFKLTLDNDGSFIFYNESHECVTSIGNFYGNCPSLPASATGAGTRFLFFEGRGAVRVGTALGSEWDENNLGIGSIAMGEGNNTIAGGGYSVLGGKNNISLSTTVASGGIFGGENNYIANPTGYISHFSTIVGGYGNTVKGSRSIATGYLNRIENPAQNSDGAVIGGANNWISGAHSAYPTLTGGYNNQNISGGDSTISGGNTNAILSGGLSTISGGANNTINGGGYNAISGGQNNYLANSGYSYLGGGYANTTDSGAYTVIAGGCNNFITLSGANQGITIAGGYRNTISRGAYATILGGYSNTLNAAATNTGSVIGGGQANSITTSNYGTIPGGSGITVNADYSLAAGKDATLTSAATKTFVWNITSDPGDTITTPNAFIINGTAKMGIGVLNPSAVLEINTNGISTNPLYLTTSGSATPGDKLKIIYDTSNGPLASLIGVGVTSPLHPLHFSNGAYVSAPGQFIDASSRSYKMDIAPLSLERARSALQQMDPVIYNYKNEKNETYVGFIAEEAPAEIVSADRTGVFALDTSAVLTKVVQDQQRKLEDQRNALEKLRSEIKDLKK